MNKLLSWMGTIGLVIAGLFLASQARRHKQRSDRLTSAQVRKETSNKQSSLEKAKRLGAKADKAMKKSQAASLQSKQQQKKLERRNETSLANRVRDFNDSL